MKHKDSISHIYIERDRKVLPELLRKAKHLATYPTSMKKLYEIAAGLPVDRFYISDDAACEYMRKRYLHGITQQFISPYKQQLFDALYDVVTKMMNEEKYRGMKLKHVTILALNRPAPCVGLTPYIISLRILKYKKRT